MLFILGGVGIVTNKNHTENPLSYVIMFSLKCLIISYSNKALLLKPASILGKESISVAKLQSEAKGFIFKEKE